MSQKYSKCPNITASPCMYNLLQCEKIRLVNRNLWTRLRNHGNEGRTGRVAAAKAFRLCRLKCSSIFGKVGGSPRSFWQRARYKLLKRFLNSPPRRGILCSRTFSAMFLSHLTYPYPSHLFATLSYPLTSTSLNFHETLSLRSPFLCRSSLSTSECN